MKTHINKAYLMTTALAASFVFFAGYVHAAMVPSMSVSAITGGTTVQVTVFGADPNASVVLNYPSTASVASTNIGTTNASGYLSTTINAATYSIASGASVYVTVDGQASPSSVWPSYTDSGSLSLSPMIITLSPGQTSTVSAVVSATLSMTANTNPSVASASISGNLITITAFNAGSTNITICAAGIGCNTVSVTVQSASSGASAVSFTPSTVSISVGQSQTVGISGSGSYYISSNSNSAIASANISGSVLTVAGVVAGSDSISVCSASGGSTSCGSVDVNVTQLANSNVSTTLANLTFSQSNLNMAVGQSQMIAIYGGTGAYYVSNNQAPGSVTANVSGTNVQITAIAFGGDNVTICSLNTQCGSFYVYVTTSGATSVPVASTLAVPAISSFSVASNDANGSFLGAANALTLTFSANQSINIPQMTVGNSAVSVNGSGSGPYSATYSMTGNESFPLPVAINFSNPAGTAGQAYFWIGTSALAPAAVGSADTTTVVTPSVPNSPTATSSSVPLFTQYLYDGSTGPQVTALQERLTADGIYSGPITGTFGSLTKAAVKAYQAKHGIDQLGVVGPATRGLLNEGI